VAELFQQIKKGNFKMSAREVVMVDAVRTAFGARVCMFTMRELIRSGGRYGFFSSCCGGGLGIATVIENLKR
jgi:acetyl-CoA acetyltransferase